MTMDFVAPKAGVPSEVKEGATVRFDFRPNNAGQYELTAIEPLKEARK